jgi:hypothetical protein
MEVEITGHFYTTDFFVKSAFNDSQIISVYYTVKPVSEILIKCKEVIFDFDDEGDIRQAFRWKKLEDLTVKDVTFPTDQRVVELLKMQWNKV